MKKYSQLSDFLLDYRKNFGLTQQDFASLLEVDSRSVIRWEKGLTQINKEKEAVIAELLAIPFQVIRNLNSDPPIAIYYDLQRRQYAHSAFGSVIMHASLFIDKFPVEDELVRTLSSKKEFEHVLKHRQEVSKSKVIDTAVLAKATDILPELNLISLDQSMFFSGHFCVLPLTANSFNQLLNATLKSWEIKQEHLSNGNDEQPNLFVYSTYGDSIPSSYYLLQRFFNFFKEHRFINYRVCCFAETDENIALWKQTGLRTVPLKENNPSSTLLAGDFDMFLFGKMT